MNSPKPSDVREVHQLLGLTGYFRQYIAGYASKTAYIARLLRKGEQFSRSSQRDYIIQCLTDTFSKYCLLYSLYRQDFDELKRVFSNAISLFGTPTPIVSDRGRMFESTAFKERV